MSSVVIRTLPADHVTPIHAYAALRAQSPGRSSFLIESSPAGDRGRRRTIVGVRARAESLYPSGFDPFTTLEADLAEQQSAAHLAVTVSQAWVGFLMYDAVHPLTGVEPWPSETYLGRVMKDATVIVFDEVAQTMTIAGASQGAVNRCAWEMAHGPELRALPAPDPEALPEHLEPGTSDEVFAVKVARARARIAEGDATSVVLARTFRAPMRGADPLDVYRALRLVAPSEHLFFFDFAESTFAPGLIVAGASSQMLVRLERDRTAQAVDGPNEGGAPTRAGGARIVEALRATFPAPGIIGAPLARASGIIRELESGPRRIYGGAIGYFGLDGCAELALGRSTVWVEGGYFEVTAGVTIAAEAAASVSPGHALARAPKTEAEQTLHEARQALSAIHTAHEAKKAADAAAEKKAAAEKAAAEQAAVEKAAAEKAPGIR